MAYMKKKEPRWYMLWFFTAGMWLLTFWLNLSSQSALDWLLILQFFNIVIAFLAGIVNARRYKQRQSENENDKDK